MLFKCAIAFLALFSLASAATPGDQIIQAARDGDISTVQQILINNPLITEKSPRIAEKHLSWALQHAAWNNQEAIVRLILNQCSQITSQNVYHPLNIAAGCGHTATVAAILELRSPIPDTYFRSIVKKAIEGGHAQVVRVLLRYSPPGFDARPMLEAARATTPTNNEIITILQEHISPSE